MNRLAMIGAGGHARVAADTAISTGDYEQIHFYDDAPLEHFLGSRCLPEGTLSDLIALADVSQKVFIGIGGNRVRETLHNRFSGVGYDIPALVHPRAWISEYSCLGNGSLVLAGAVINCDTQLGVGVIINTSSSVDHDCLIGNFCHISPGANLAGGVSVGNRSWVGIGASVRENISIGSDCVIGAGAVVLEDVPDGSVVVGVPARPMLGERSV